MYSIKTAISLTAITVANAQNLGSWGPTINFPLVPVAGAVIPTTGQLLVWSAYSTSTFGIGKQNVTQTAVWDPVNENVTQYEVAYTNHDMFCPGISLDFAGRLVVTGGDTAPRTSIYQPQQGTWLSAPDMVLPRGYQSSTTLSDGRIFTIGGSWSPPRQIKNGEVWDGQKWTYLPGALGRPMLTADKGGIFRQDSHAWLFGWKNGSVIQAGPSKAMNWYYTDGQGSTGPAGVRNGDDAMCGPVVMYDAVAGSVLAAGGSPDYEKSPASSKAYVMTIGEPGQNLQVEEVAPMAAARIFANSIVLPDGKVFVIGGQTFGHPFFDDNSTMVPELWDPATKSFSLLQKQPTPRNYHSMALLMPNGTVFSGGGGLCGKCGGNNHFNGQLFTPPNLLQADGVTPALRPAITKVSAHKVSVGGLLQATVSNPTNGTMSFSLIRMGSSTHTVNTDQRRVPLVPVRTSTDHSVFTLQMPKDAGILLPGYWYLFALSQGVPSIAEIIRIAA